MSTTIPAPTSAPTETNAEYPVLDKGIKIPTAHAYEGDWRDGYPYVPDAKFLDEIRMLKLMQTIIAKPEWYTKLSNKEIRQKWVQEAEEQNIRKEVAEWALKELDWCARVRDNETGVEPTGIEHVWKSDKLISASLHDRFLATVHELEKSLPEDFHPGTEGQVKNLIHPSLFCLVYGLSADNNGNVINEPDSLSQIVEITNSYPSRPCNDPKLWSHKYQWLPAEFLVDKNNTTKIASYINGLPTHVKGGAEMYTLLGEIFGKTVPLFEHVLSSICSHHDLVRYPHPQGYGWWDTEEYDGEPPSLPDGLEEQLWEEWREAPEGYDLARYKYWEENFKPAPLPLPDFPEPAPMDVSEDKKIKLGGHRLQVIVKIGQVLLTPERPQFEAGNWHIEGMANEHIVATAIYYFDSQNIKDDRLRFRHAVELETDEFAQDDTAGAHLMYGLHRDEGMVQEAGDIATPPGRVLVFPNIYQHSIGSFSLEDTTKPGHRSILVFFLVDPTWRITSTAHVPPQDPSWYPSETMNLMLQQLPIELRWEVGKNLSPFTRELAEEHRLKLMEERTYATDAVTEEVFMRPFNLCEH
ncbi:hypothetical protein C8Q75DRAFT_755011 [Abortiporus biennis]|nr:hypothetical protein C8Q75DRAFT_755011 [Abortiporus biennis]